MKPGPKFRERTKFNTITAVLLDDEEREFPVEITYDYHLYFGLMNETIVTGYDFKVNGDPKISQKDLHLWVKDQIREEERRPVTFF